MINLICWVFGHIEYNQSHRYDFKSWGRKKPYFTTVCYRCGKSKETEVKKDV